MPTSVNIQGKTKFVPGVYGVVDASALAGRNTSTGNLAVVGDFPVLQNDTPTDFKTAQELRAFDPNNAVLQRVAALAFSPAADDRIGGPNKLTLVNVRTVTQAGYEFPDADNGANKSVKFSARHWGQKGNQVYVELKANASDTTKLDVKVAQGSRSETYTALGVGGVVTFSAETNSELGVNGADPDDTAKVSVDKSKFTWRWERQCKGGDNVSEPVTKLVVQTGEKITAKARAPSAAGDALAVTVTGLDKNGVAKTGTATFTHPVLVNDTKILQVDGVDGEWSRVDTVKWDAQGAYPLTPPTLAATAFDLALTEAVGFKYVDDVVRHVNNSATKGWVATSIKPQTGAIPANELDKVVAYDAFGTVLTVRANLWAFVEALKVSDVVTVARVTTGAADGQKMPYPSGQAAGTVVDVNLLGGAESSVSVAVDYADALVKLVNKDVQVVAVMDTDVEAPKALKTHCENAALAGSERCGYAGTTASQTLAAVFDNWIAKVNSRHVAIAGQQITVTDPVTGVAVDLDPPWFGLLGAAAQCGRSVGVPLTFKRLGVLGTKQDTGWVLGTSDDEVVEKSIFAVTKDVLGFKFLRSVTSYATDANVVFSEISANESMNYSIRNLRDQLITKIGDPATISPELFKSVVVAVLRKQVEDGFVRDFKENSVKITQTGDKYRVDYDVAPVLPLNFVVVYAHAYV